MTALRYRIARWLVPELFADLAQAQLNASTWHAFYEKATGTGVYRRQTATPSKDRQWPV